MRLRDRRPDLWRLAIDLSVAGAACALVLAAALWTGV